MNKFIAIITLTILSGCSPVRNDSTDVSAIDWFKVVEREDYEAVYAGMSNKRSANSTFERVTNAYKNLNKNLGKAIRRDLSIRTFTDTINLPYPDGEYVILDYNTTYERKKTAYETVILSKENGEWKVLSHRFGSIHFHH